MARRKPKVYYGTSEIASWLGVTVNTVVNWYSRHGDTIPVPDVVVAGRNGAETWGWLPHRKADWEAWNEARLAPRPSKAAERERQRYALSESGAGGS